MARSDDAMPKRADLNLLYAARGLRGFGDGFAVILIPAYLSAIGYDAIYIGIVAAASLLGSAVLTLAVGLLAPRHDLRKLLLLAAGVMVATGLAFPAFENIVFIAVVGFVGTVNPSAGDIGVFIPLEHAMVARGIADRERTAAFARYSLIGALAAAAGALAAALPDLLASAGIGRIAAFRLMFYAYALLGVAGAILYRQLPRSQLGEARHSAPLGPSRARCSRSGCSSDLIFHCRRPAPSSSGRAS